MDSDDIESQRVNFDDLSNELTSVLKFYGLSSNITKTLYVKYCPMALGNKGTYWISSSRDIRNPYFDQTILKCGETRDLIRIN